MRTRYQVISSRHTFLGTKRINDKATDVFFCVYKDSYLRRAGLLNINVELQYTILATRDVSWRGLRNFYSAQTAKISLTDTVNTVEKTSHTLRAGYFRVIN